MLGCRVTRLKLVGGNGFGIGSMSLNIRLFPGWLLRAGSKLKTD